jgi:hypothetical protein
MAVTVALELVPGWTVVIAPNSAQALTANSCIYDQSREQIATTHVKLFKHPWRPRLVGSVSFYAQQEKYLSPPCPCRISSSYCLGSLVRKISNQTPCVAAVTNHDTLLRRARRGRSTVDFAEMTDVLLGTDAATSFSSGLEARLTSSTPLLVSVACSDAHGTWSATFLTLCSLGLCMAGSQ